MIYKQQRIVRKLPTCRFSPSDLENLIELCINIHSECIQKFKMDIEAKKFFVQNLHNDNKSKDDIPDTDEEESKQDIIKKQGTEAKQDTLKEKKTDDKDNSVKKMTPIEKHVIYNYLWALEVIGSNGEYLYIQDLTKLKTTDLPFKIDKIKFNNYFSYEYINARKPSVHFEVSVDFQEVKIFDLISSPTESTTNDSFVEVTGLDQTMVIGLTGRFESFFKKYETYNSLVNIQNIYDIILWFVFVPILSIYLVKYQDLIPEVLRNSSTFVQVVLAISSLFVALLFFRFLFNVARWFFPCQELTSQVSRGRKLSKYVYSLIITTLIGGVGVNFIYWLYIKLIS